MLGIPGCAKHEDPYAYTARRTVESEELLRWYRSSGEVDAVPFVTEVGEDPGSGTSLALITVWPGEGGYVTSLYRRDGAVWRWMGEKAGAPGACLLPPHVDRKRFEMLAVKLTERLPERNRFPNAPCRSQQAGWALYTNEHFVVP